SGRCAERRSGTGSALGCGAACDCGAGRGSARAIVGGTVSGVRAKFGSVLGAGASLGRGSTCEGCGTCAGNGAGSRSWRWKGFCALGLETGCFVADLGAALGGGAALAAAAGFSAGCGALACCCAGWGANSTVSTLGCGSGVRRPGRNAT